MLPIASRRLRASLETALIVLQKWTVCVGCGYSGVRDGAGKNAPVWVKVNPESGLGLCSGCDAFLLQERQRRQRHDQLFHVVFPANSERRRGRYDSLCNAYPGRYSYERKDAVRTF
ncbi:hypothetical protein OHD37_13150 [Escherichia coli]|nr:hypothetical protein [Escherichia coli]